MLNRLVPRTMYASLNHGLGVSWQFVSDDHIHIFANMLLDVFRQCSRLGVFRMKESKFPGTLTDTNHNLFVLVRRQRSDLQRPLRRGRQPKVELPIAGFCVRHAYFESMIAHRPTMS